MLVLARQQNECIVVRTPCGVMRVQYQGQSDRNPRVAHIGIDAPSDWLVLREELVKNNGINVEGTRPAALDVSKDNGTTPSAG